MITLFRSQNIRDIGPFPAFRFYMDFNQNTGIRPLTAEKLRGTLSLFSAEYKRFWLLSSGCTDLEQVEKSANLGLLEK